MSEKTDFVENLRRSITQIAQHATNGEELVSTWTKREYQSGGSDEMTDEDISSTGITAAEMALGITLFNNLKKFRFNDTPTQNDYEATMAKLRNDIK